MDNHFYSGMGSAAIHASHAYAEHAHLVPVFATSTFTFDSVEQGMQLFSGKEEGFIYSRYGNPTARAAEEVLERLEAFGLQNPDGSPLQVKALLHSSGQAAMSTLFLSNLVAGDAVVSHRSLYGGTHEFIYDILPQYGIRPLLEDFRDLAKVEAIIKQTPALKLVHIETPANPSIQCVDIEAVCRIAGQQGVLVSVDNTFATPYLQQPFAYGADFVFHSTTKFLNGHGTAIGGVLLGRDIDFMKTRAFRHYKLLGGNSNPFDAFLLIQGIKTLEVRMDRHCCNAAAVAEFLSAHAAVAKVNYNGLPAHPDYAVSRKQMRQPGAVLSFELNGGLDAGKRFVNRLRMCTRAVSLGTVDTLVSHPASMSHMGLAREERLAAGISDGLIRMSVGIENIADILSDLEQALQHEPA